jgi:hypothetical protein
MDFGNFKPHTLFPPSIGVHPSLSFQASISLPLAPTHPLRSDDCSAVTLRGGTAGGGVTARWVVLPVVPAARGADGGMGRFSGPTGDANLSRVPGVQLYYNNTLADGRKVAEEGPSR